MIYYSDARAGDVSEWGPDTTITVQLQASYRRRWVRESRPFNDCGGFPHV